MKTTKLALTLCLGLFIVVGQPRLSLAAEPEENEAKDSETLPVEVPTVEETANPVAGEELGVFGSYAAFWDRQVEHIGKTDPFGVTATVAKGYMYLKGELTSFEIGGRYDTKRNLVSAFPAVNVKNKAEKTILSADLGLQGTIGYRTFEVGYGITDMLTFVLKVPTVYMDTSFNPTVQKLDDGNYVLPGAAANMGVTDPAKYNGCDFLNSTLGMLGRPVPKAAYHGDWLLGDISAGFSWNVYRSKCTSYPCLSVALSPRVYFPTAGVQDSDNSLTYITGPALETGLGGWAVGSTQGLDVRLFKHGIWIDIIASSELSATYGFEQNRSYPTGYRPVTWEDSGETGLKDWRPFLDVSDVKGEFRYTPGWQMDWLAQLQVTSTIVTLAAAYLVKFNQDPEIKADPDFALMVRTWGMVGQGLTESIRLSAIINLMPLYVPADVSFQYTEMLDGYNTMKYDNYYSVMLKLYIPIFPDA